MLLLTHKTASFTDAIALDKAIKAEQKAMAKATATKAAAWELQGHRKPSKCITVVNADAAKVAAKQARIAHKKAIVAEQKRLFDAMLKAYNLENEIIIE